MKTLTSFLLCLSIFHVFSQADTSGRHISAVQIEISTAPYTPYASPTQQELQALAPSGIFLDRDLTGFEKQAVALINTRFFQGMAGIKVFIHETSRCETFVGARFGQALISGTVYNQSVGDTNVILVDTTSGRAALQVLEANYQFNYTVIADRLYFPIGFNFFTRQNKFIWASAGFELCPFVNFSYLFQSGVNYFTHQDTINAGERIQVARPATESGSYNIYQKMNGMSVGMYFGLPIAGHLNPFERSSGSLRHFQLLITLLPSYSFNSSEFGKIVSAPSLAINAGIRYNIR